MSSSTIAQDKWVNVTWMPHNALAQSSYVCLLVRSAHTVIDRLKTKQTTVSSSALNDWKVQVRVHAVGGLELAPISVQSSSAPLIERNASTSEQLFRPNVAVSTHDCRWNSFLKLPIRWRDLPRDSYLKFDVFDDTKVRVYSATLPLFSQYGKLTTGLRRIELHKFLDEARNYGVYCHRDSNAEEEKYDPVWESCLILDQLERVERRTRQPNKSAFVYGQIQSVPWLDKLTKESAEATIAHCLSSQKYPILPEVEGMRSYLIVELPTFEIPIMHEQSFYPTPTQGASGFVTPLDVTHYRKNEAKSLSKKPFDPLSLVDFLDYENEQENPVEDKYRTLAHDLLRGLVDPALKPDRSQRDRLAAIIDSTGHHLTREEKDLLWRFRFSLVDNRRAVSSFLLAVDWTVDSEVVQAAELLEQWRKRSPIEVTDALMLLGKHVAFQTSLVRSYAIDTLEAAPDSELRLYLLQLVQALKYENVENRDSGNVSAVSRAVPTLETKEQSLQASSLATFLINRASKNVGLANFLYWYLKVELDNPTHGVRYREVFSLLERKLSTTDFEVIDSLAASVSEESIQGAASKSFKYLVGSVSTKIGNSFRSDPGEKDAASASSIISSSKSKIRTMWDVLVAQDKFFSGLLGVQQKCRESRGRKDQKEEDLKIALVKEGYGSTRNGAIPLPSSPDIFVSGVRPETAKIFKSALYPALIDFHVDFWMVSTDQAESSSSHVSLPKSCKVIVKTGDDLRQDQLIIMIIQLMDGLLKRAALDLCLTPYSILATSPTSGLVAFVADSVPISQVLSQNNGSILQFFKSSAPQLDAKYDVKPEVLNTYVRSLAGYCVITYLLGVGDRHLDNILLRSTGYFFHIDFGFIFGRDPKPLPPPFRLTREMVDGMGGSESSEYRQFCSLSCQAFNALRKSAGLVLNLLALMSDAGIEDLSNNPLGDSEAVIAKVEDRFRLDLTDEQAEQFFVGLINDCLVALAPRVMDVFHSFAVARR